MNCKGNVRHLNAINNTGILAKQCKYSFDYSNTCFFVEDNVKSLIIIF